MKILHILNDGPGETPDRIIEVQSREHEVEVIDLTANELSYETIVDRILAADRVVSW